MHKSRTKPLLDIAPLYIYERVVYDQDAGCRPLPFLRFFRTGQAPHTACAAAVRNLSLLTSAPWTRTRLLSLT